LRFDLSLDRFSPLNDELCPIGCHIQKLPRTMDKGNPVTGVLFGFSPWVYSLL